MRRRGWLWGLKAALFGAAAVGVVSLAVMALWNALLPGIFEVRAITFPQALGLLILSRLLFGGFRPGGGMGWRRRMWERWEKMTPEERARFQQGMRGCGGRRETAAANREAEARA